MTIKYLYLNILLAVVLFVPALAFASTYSVAPLIIDYELEKRDIVHEDITITNQGSNVIRLYPTVNEVSLGEGGGIESFVEPSMLDNRGAEITSWIQVSRARTEIQPGESVTIPVKIHINPEVQAGEYRAFIGFAEGSNRPEAEKKVRAGTAPGTIIRISVDKVQNQFLRLAKFSVERFVTENKENSITYVLENPGSDPVTPAGEIIFYDNSGTEMYSLPVNPDNQVISGEESLSFADSVPDELKMGKYKAFLSVEYGENLTASIHDTAFFYKLPLKLIIVLFIIILLLAIVIALYVHKKFDVVNDDGSGAEEIPMYLRSERSESKDHDIDLSSQKNKD